MKKNIISRLKSRPKTFRSISGLTVSKFDILYEKLLPLYTAAEEQRLSKISRERSVGGGRKKELTLEEQLLMLLMYYRLYVSQEFLGILFNLHNCNVSRQIKYLEPLLAKIFRIPSKSVKLNGTELSEEKLLELFVDATEQPVTRSKKNQKNYYSGKKKKHTIKNQIVVDTTGKIRAVSPSIPGKKHDKKLYDEEKPIIPSKNKELLGDLGYLGGSGVKTPNKKTKGGELTEEEKQENIELSKRRIKVEHCFGKMKIFQILVQRFRNPKNNHSLIFKNVAGLHNLMFT